ncbi:Reverse transcriptase domain [Arabidopsis thaliana x Arabidopsis arenosa]|uniref:Reverse transcriptase domain n=1 Tax=Arabidopsis thaliana x Arabidopsis arenosa TaxID=1240361 RepID=A0A8T1XJU5_9BRAS|nr:Reverse transcriptase domain [Arabidopsis thaliana x Arabidopsis arenosa]
MKFLGFSEYWIRLVMECVKTVQYQVLINGTPYGEIKPTRGLRQGDPLSPYLFVICTEMLVRMLQKAEGEKQITGLKVARGAPSITHMLFADDSLFYCQEKDSEINQVVRIIEEYSLASGQRVNYQKSSIYFGKQIPLERREEVKQKLGISQEGGEGIYLGLPESFSGSKVATLSYLRDRLSQKVSGWQSNFLSPGGKEMLLKAVAMALPTYTMACFKLPTTICKQLVSVMADFWWRNKKDTKGMHWKSWEALSKPKAEGGLGFKDIEAFNLALLGKQLWRMLTHKDSLLAKVYKSRYFRHSDPLSAPLGSRPSFAWKSIHAAQELIKQGARAVVGNGENINIWKHQWIQSKPARSLNCVNHIPPGLHHSVSQAITVKDLLEMNGREWRWELLNLMFSEDDRKRIEAIRPGGSSTKDRYTWDYAKTGQYSVKSGYWVLTQILNKRSSSQEVVQPSLDPLYQKIWKLEAPPKYHPTLAYEPKLIPWLLWRLWKNINDLTFKGKEQDALTLVSKAGEDADEWERRKEDREARKLPAMDPQPQVKWKSPPQGWVKCNVDGAWPRAGDHCGIGWVLRNVNGEVLWLGARALRRTQTVLEVEAEALRWAVVNMHKFNYRKVIFESDSQELIS